MKNAQFFVIVCFIVNFVSCNESSFRASAPKKPQAKKSEDLTEINKDDSSNVEVKVEETGSDILSASNEDVDIESTPTPSPSTSASPTPSPTASPTPSSTPSPTATPTPTPSPTVTPTPTPNVINYIHQASCVDVLHAGDESTPDFINEARTDAWNGQVGHLMECQIVVNLEDDAGLPVGAEITDLEVRWKGAYANASIGNFPLGIRNFASGNSCYFGFSSIGNTHLIVDPNQDDYFQDLGGSLGGEYWLDELIYSATDRRIVIMNSGDGFGGCRYKQQTSSTPYLCAACISDIEVTIIYD